MTMIGREADKDPLDYSRLLILENAERAARYAQMLAECIEMRDDDGAYVMLTRLAAQMNSIKTGFTALAAGRAQQPARDAAAHFDRTQTSTEASPP